MVPQMVPVNAVVWLKNIAGLLMQQSQKKTCSLFSQIIYLTLSDICLPKSSANVISSIIKHELMPHRGAHAEWKELG